jgi:hypothetical protein
MADQNPLTKEPSMFELIALYRSTVATAEARDYLFEVVLGKRDDWNQANQAAQSLMSMADATYRPLRVRIRPVLVVRS